MSRPVLVKMTSRATGNILLRKEGETHNESKKILAVLLSLCMVFGLLAGCNNAGTTESDPGQANTQGGGEQQNTPSGSEEQQNPTDGYLADNITVAISNDGGTFDPFASFTNWGDGGLSGLVFEGLIAMDFYYTVYNNMAETIEQVDDTHWKLTLRDGILDTNNNQITMDDVIWSYKQYIDAGNQGGVPKFVEWEKESDLVGIMVLSEAFADGDYEKHFGNVRILSQKAYEEDSNGDMTQMPIGTGPYKLKSYNVGTEVVMEVNENYWALDKGVENPLAAQNFKTITYEIIPDASARAIALESGQVDAVDQMDSIDVDNLLSKGGFTALDVPVRAPVSVVLNANEASPLSDLKLRQGILYGINNTQLADAIPVIATECYGLQPLMVDTPSSWLDGSREYYGYDKDKAQQLVDESSYSGETLTLMLISGDTMVEQAATIIKAQLKEIGVNIELRAVDQTVANQDQYDPTKFDIRMATLGGGAYMSQTTKGWWYADGTQHYPEGSKWNFSMVADETLDGLYEALKDDNSEANINAWGDYFDSMAYGYTFCYYSKQTLCVDTYTAGVTGSQGSAIVPNALVLA